MIDFEGFKDCRFKICSRNYIIEREIEEPEGTQKLNYYLHIAEKYNIEEKLKDTNLAIQGEIVGPGIQKNHLCLNDGEFRLFDVFDLREKKYLEWNELKYFSKFYDIPLVRIIEEGAAFFPEYKYIKELNETEFDEESRKTVHKGLKEITTSLLQKAEFFYPNTKNWAEGIVVGSKHHIQPENKIISFKVISNKFLIKNNE
jgi:hypothetical protein